MMTLIFEAAERRRLMGEVAACQTVNIPGISGAPGYYFSANNEQWSSRLLQRNDEGEWEKGVSRRIGVGL